MEPTGNILWLAFITSNQCFVVPSEPEVCFHHQLGGNFQSAYNDNVKYRKMFFMLH